jgi:hypothetical protein
MNNTLTTINELRKHLKPLGYKVKTKSYSIGRFVTYVHTATGEELTGNVFSSKTLALWDPLFAALKQIQYTPASAEDALYGVQP